MGVVLCSSRQKKVYCCGHLGADRLVKDIHVATCMLILTGIMNDPNLPYIILS